MHARALSRRGARAAILVDRCEEGYPFLLLPHAMEPVAPIGDRDLTDRRARIRLGRGDEDRVPAAGPAASEDRSAPWIDVVAPAHVCERIAPVLELPRRRERPAIALARSEAAVVEDKDRESSVGERVVIRLIELRVRESHPSRSLHDERPSAGRLIGAMKEAVQANAVAEERDLIGPHAFAYT